MARLLFIVCLFTAASSFAQPLRTQEEKNLTLQQRYASMKAKAETYQDYKVIKEYIMDGVWRIMLDSVKGQRLLIAQGRQTISQLESDLQSVRSTLAKEREAASQIVHDSTHISLLGIDLRKSAFIILVAITLSFIFFIGSAMVTKMKLLQAASKEKIVIANLVTQEFDEFKKKAMEKQIKLARELQDERNKVAELKESRLAK